MNPENDPSISFITIDEYNRDINSRLLEDEMDTHTVYPFIVKLLWSRHGDAAEFQAQLTRVERLPHQLGEASLALCVFYGGAENEPLIVFDARSEQGIIVPDGSGEGALAGQSRRISHPQYGHLGAFGNGYLLGPSEEPSRLVTNTPHELSAHEPWNENDPSTTWTRALALSGIYPSSD